MMFLILSMFACGDKSTDTATEEPVDTGSDTTDTSDTTDDGLYAFMNADGESSVSYSGQIFRHLLINDVKGYVGDLNTRLATDVVATDIVAPGDVTDDLMFYYDTISDVDVAMVPHGFTNDAFGLVQANYGDVSSGKNIFGKLAGNDAATDHKDWMTEFVGWDEMGVTSPESLVLMWTQRLDEQAVNWTTLSSTVPSVYVSPAGQDYGQLLQKFLLGAVAFSQGADDYMDDDVAGKGLLASHILAEGQTYSPLEHAWDEGFGYFGAAQDYSTWTDDDIQTNGSMDRNEDGNIDLKTEVNWGHSSNAGKRDVGSNDPTVDLTRDAWNGFYQGRVLLNQTVGSELSETDLNTLRGYRDEAVAAWEMAIVATVVHYINDTIQDVNAEADLGDLAKHWSEMKGFALSMQFNPRSPLADDDFSVMHTLMDIAPTRSQDYVQDLIEARTILGDAYGIDAVNLGDENGENGW
jgi:hypothetical protein